MKNNFNPSSEKIPERWASFKKAMWVLLPLIPLSVALFYPMQDIFKESLLIGLSIFCSLIILKKL